jgi:hypothetical protein
VGRTHLRPSACSERSEHNGQGFRPFHDEPPGDGLDGGDGFDAGGGGTEPGGAGLDAGAGGTDGSGAGFDGGGLGAGGPAGFEAGDGLDAGDGFEAGPALPTTTADRPVNACSPESFLNEAMRPYFCARALDAQ